MGLGVYIAPDGSNREQLQYIKVKVKSWTRKIKASCMSRYAAILALPTTIWATLSYPLAAITLTKRECE